ncbi:hypothetical protein ACI2IP_00670 [Microbacterium sp. NPDC090218]
MITTLEALRLLESRAGDLENLHVETGVRDGAAYLRIASNERWSVVYTPGDRWFSVETDQGFSANHFEEDVSVSDVIEILDHQIAIACSYVGGEYEMAKSRFLGVPEIVIRIGETTTVLTLSPLGAVRRIRHRER